MSKVIMLTGGVRSGKSTQALKLAGSKGVPGMKKAFVATGAATDSEMTERIKKHKEERADDYDTYEETENVSALLRDITEEYDIIIVDCMTFLVNNMMFNGRSDDEILEECDLIAKSVKGKGATVIFVTNEVGLGIVPENGLARRFRDLAGRVNQKIAEISDEVYFMVSGLPMEIKREA